MDSLSPVVHREVAHLAPQVIGEFVALVDVGGPRGDLVVGEAHDGIPQHVGAVAEGEIETGKLV